MKYTPPPGSLDQEAPYITGIPGIKRGSPVPAEAVEHPQREITHCIKMAGLTPDPNDLTQLYQAIGKLGLQPGPDNYALFSVGGALEWRPVKQFLTAPLTLYVHATNGSDTNDGLTPAMAMRSLKAVYARLRMFDSGGYEVKVMLAPGVYAAVETNLSELPGNMTLLSNGGSATNTIIDGYSNFYGTGSLAAHNIQFQYNPASHPVWRGTVTTGPGADLKLYNCNVQQNHTNAIGIYALGGTVTITGNCTISNMGDGASCAIVAASGGSIQALSASLAISGAFQAATVWAATNGTTDFYLSTCTGSVTGRRYTAELNGVINTRGGGQNFIPGSIAGTETLGGRYA